MTYRIKVQVEFCLLEARAGEARAVMTKAEIERQLVKLLGHWGIADALESGDFEWESSQILKTTLEPV